VRQCDTLVSDYDNQVTKGAQVPCANLGDSKFVAESHPSIVALHSQSAESHLLSDCGLDTSSKVRVSHPNVASEQTLISKDVGRS
jgi:hypothetical protein